MTKVIVVKTVDRLERFECRACGHTARARVRLRTAGAAREDEEDAEQKAADAVEADTRTALGLVRCPRCGRRSSRGLVNLALWTLLPALFFSTLGVWFWAIGGLAKALGAVWVVAALGVLLLGQRSLARAEREVRFLDR